MQGKFEGRPQAPRRYKEDRFVEQRGANGIYSSTRHHQDIQHGSMRYYQRLRGFGLELSKPDMSIDNETGEERSSAGSNLASPRKPTTCYPFLVTSD